MGKKKTVATESPVQVLTDLVKAIDDITEAKKDPESTNQWVIGGIDGELMRRARRIVKIEDKRPVAKRSKLPHWCYAYLPSNPRKGIIIVSHKERGYGKTLLSGGRRRAIQMNAEMNVTVPQMEAMLAGSMYGWRVPSARPEMYNNDGTVISKPKARKAARG